MGNRRLGSLLAAACVSNIGDSLTDLTVMLWIFELSGRNAEYMVALTAIQLIASTLSGPLSGLIVARSSAARTLMLSNVFRGVIGIVLIGAAAMDNLPLALVSTFFATVAGVVSNVSTVTLIPELAGPNELERANATLSMAQQISFIIGPGVAAVLFAHLGPCPALAIDAATFLPIIVLGGVLGTPGPLPGQLAPSDSVHAGQAVIQGLKIIKRNPILLNCVAGNSIRAITAGINGTVMIFMVTEVLGRHASEIAWLGVANGCFQAIAGGYIVARSSKLRLYSMVRVGALLMFLGGLIVGGARSLVMLVFGVLVTSVGNSPANIAANTLEQQEASREWLPMVRGTQEALLPLCALIGAGAGGVLVAEVGARTALWVSAGLTGLVLFMVESFLIPAMRGSRSVDI